MQSTPGQQITFVDLGMFFSVKLTVTHADGVASKTATLLVVLLLQFKSF